MQHISLKKKIVFYATPLLLFGFFLEALLFWVSREQILVKSADPQMIYSLYPNRMGIAAGPEYKVEVSTDRFGLRFCSQKKSPSVSKDAPVLLLLGDSFAEGWGVSCPATYASRLQSLLPAWRIRNAGVHGGSPAYFILRARVFRKLFSPKIVVVQLFDNDLDDLDKIRPYFTTSKLGYVLAANPPGLGPLPAGLFTRKIRELAIYRTLKRAWHLAQGKPLPIKYYKLGREPKEAPLSHEQALKKFGKLKPLNNPDADYNGQFGFYKYHTLAGIQKAPIWKDRFQKTRLYLKQLIDEARKEEPGVKIIFFYIPAKEVFAKGGILGRQARQKKTPAAQNCRFSIRELRAKNPFYQLLFEITKKESIHLLDGQEVFYVQAQDLYFPGDAHLNALGHQRAANALFRLIKGTPKNGSTRRQDSSESVKQNACILH